MRLRTFFVTIGLCVVTSGCQLTWDITRNLAFQASLNTDTMVSKIEYCHMANLALVEYSSHHPEPAESPDFVKGFKKGYADYLEYGGSVLPPPIPPLKYWKCRYQSKEGRMATTLWNTGYKEGASAAKASGARNFIVVPYNKIVSPESQPGPVPGASLPGADPGVLPPGSVPFLPPERELPLPRQAPKEPAQLPAPKEPAPLSPAKQPGAGPSQVPQASLEPLGGDEADGGQNAEITLTDAPLAPASLGSPRPLPPQQR